MKTLPADKGNPVFHPFGLGEESMYWIMLDFTVDYRMLKVSAVVSIDSLQGR